MPRPRRAKDPILAATLDLIAEHGVTGVTVDTVAARVGASKATIYRHWGSRARLIHAAISHMQWAFVEPDTGSLRADLTVLLRQLVAYLTRPDIGPAIPSFLEAAARDPELAALRDETVGGGRAVYERVIRRGIERGELRPGTDPGLFTDLVMAPFIYRQVATRSPRTAADIGPVIDAVLGGFRPDVTHGREPGR